MSLLLALLMSSPVAAEAPEVGTAGPVHTLESLAGLDRKELRDLFEAGVPGKLPAGEVSGKVVQVGMDLGPKRWLLNRLWAGKVFYPQEAATEEIGGKPRRVESTLHNIVFGRKSFKGQVYLDASWLDGKPCWVIDYRESSPAIGHIRDEFRHLGRGLYLGWTFDRTPAEDGTPGRRFMLNFAIQAAESRG